MVGFARRETQRAHRIVSEGECDGGGVGEDDGIRNEWKAGKWREAADWIRCLLQKLYEIP